MLTDIRWNEFFRKLFMRQPYLLFLFFIIVAATASGQRKPSIIGQNSVNTNEEQAVTVELSHLRVDDLFYPLGYTLTVYEGDNYTLSNKTVTPVLDFTGTLSVGVTVSNGRGTSAVYALQVVVNPLNDAPKITGQESFQIVEDIPMVVPFTVLKVSDPDNTYPTGFTINFSPGTNYTVQGNTITPAANFNGTLTVNTTVSDGDLTSNVFPLKIIVTPDNDPPVITGQIALSTSRNKPITLQLSNLTVTDIDNTYPNGFTLIISPGSQYTVSGTTVTPAQDFTGTLTVPVTVSDGNDASAPYNVKITVIDELQITSQVKLEMNEDESITLALTHLIVDDSDNAYPTGFTLQIKEGNNYTIEGLKIIPVPNFAGNLSVDVSVKNSRKTSNTFKLTITVKPVNDPPEVTSLETEAITYIITDEPVSITKTLNIKDPDDNTLVMAEVGFQPNTFRSGADELLFQSIGKISGVYNAAKGTLTLAGNASLAEYQSAIRSIQYYYSKVENPVIEPKTVYIQLNDGKTISALYERNIQLKEAIEFDIPNAFTPNDDFSNDTWKVQPLKPSERFVNAVIRIYNKRGALVFQANGLDEAWDGKSNGEPLPPDTYYYTIDLNLSSVNTKYKGSVVILR